MSKHIDVRLHFIQDVIETKEILVEKIPTEENHADDLTKFVPQSKFKHCLDLIGFYEEYKLWEEANCDLETRWRFVNMCL